MNQGDVDLLLEPEAPKSKLSAVPTQSASSPRATRSAKLPAALEVLHGTIQIARAAPIGSRMRTSGYATRRKTIPRTASPRASASIAGTHAAGLRGGDPAGDVADAGAETAAEGAEDERAPGSAAAARSRAPRPGGRRRGRRPRRSRACARGPGDCREALSNRGWAVAGPSIEAQVQRRRCRHWRPQARRESRRGRALRSPSRPTRPPDRASRRPVTNRRAPGGTWRSSRAR